MAVSTCMLAALLCLALLAQGAEGARTRAAGRSDSQLQTRLPGAPVGIDSPGAVVPSAEWVAPAQANRPMLFFLFLVYVKINNEDVWNRFLSQAIRGVDYRALVHCKDAAECRTNIRALDRYEIIQPVETQYCFDLVSGMNELLRQAVKDQASHPNDKFVFVSDSTVPLKPFSYIQHRLTVQDGQASNFCIFPRNEWAEVADSFAPGQSQLQSYKVGVKHHQWLVLNREHALISVNRSGELMDLMNVFQLNLGYRNTGCLDEFWHFATLYTWLHLGSQAATVEFLNFGGGPLRTDIYEVQGRCDTWVFWPPRAAGKDNNITRLARLLSDDPGSLLQPPTEKRPSSISRLSRQSLMYMRESPFLFARKLDDRATFSGCHTLAEAFEGLVFADHPERFEDADPTWVGDGKWLDTRKLPVSIRGVNGSASIVGVTQDRNDLKATGHYCGDMLNAEFSTGFTSNARLWCKRSSGLHAGFSARVPCSRMSSMEPHELHWDNGAVWRRAPAST